MRYRKENGQEQKVKRMGKGGGESNAWTIVRKEFARFFGDRQLVFTALIMPGLLIYVIYSLMGSGISRMVTEGAQEVVTVRVEHLPASMASVLPAVDSSVVLLEQSFGADEVAALEDKDLNVVLVRFPEGFDGLVTGGESHAEGLLPNVEIYYNSTNNASARVYAAYRGLLENWGRPFTVNAAQAEIGAYDQASEESIGAMVWSKILPMLIMMLLFSGVMAIAPSAIAGEKERGTIATLLVTPMRRSELAVGKIFSLSCIALLSGISSFVGIALSLPRMIATEGAVDLGFHYGASDYAVLLAMIFVSVLIMASVVSLLSALAKDVKNAGTIITPFMLVVMLAGLLPMFQSGSPSNLGVYLIPFYNSIEVMAAVFGHEVQWAAVAVTIGADLVYAGVAVWGMTKMFNSEKVMFGR